MTLDDCLEAQSTVQAMLRVPFDGKIRSGLVKLDVIMRDVIEFRSQVSDLSTVDIQDADIIRNFLLALFA